MNLTKVGGRAFFKYTFLFNSCLLFLIPILEIYNKMQDVWGSKNIPAMSSLQSKDPEHIERVIINSVLTVRHEI